MANYEIETYTHWSETKRTKRENKTKKIYNKVRI